MDKLFEKIHEVQAYTNISVGLSLAVTVIRRRLMEATTSGEKDILLRTLGDIVLLLEEAKNNVTN